MQRPNWHPTSHTRADLSPSGPNKAQLLRRELGRRLQSPRLGLRSPRLVEMRHRRLREESEQLLSRRAQGVERRGPSGGVQERLLGVRFGHVLLSKRVWKPREMRAKRVLEDIQGRLSLVLQLCL